MWCSVSSSTWRCGASLSSVARSSGPAARSKGRAGFCSSTCIDFGFVGERRGVAVPPGRVRPPPAPVRRRGSRSVCAARRGGPRPAAASAGVRLRRVRRAAPAPWACCRPRLVGPVAPGTTAAAVRTTGPALGRGLWPRVRCVAGAGLVAAVRPVRWHRARACTVGASNSVRSGSSTSNADRTCDISRVASSEWPPRAKKSSSTPTSSMPSTCVHSAAQPLFVGRAWRRPVAGLDLLGRRQGASVRPCRWK